MTYGWPAQQYGGVTTDLVVHHFRSMHPLRRRRMRPPPLCRPIAWAWCTVRARHGWPLGTEARDGGEWDGWVPAKNPLTMAYREREDVPYHRALADAFTGR